MIERILIRSGTLVGFALVLVCLAGGWVYSQPVDAGYRDSSYGPDVRPTPTGEKPESKLWHADGSWWGVLYSQTWGAFHIHRLDLATQTWVDTGVPVDERESSSADALWASSSGKLYIASHVFNYTGLPRTDQSLWGRLYRYSYDSSSRSYSLDTGFPVLITQGISETLVLARDSMNRLWVTWVESNRVMVNHTLDSDDQWAVPFQVPVEDADNVSGDDISSIISFQGGRIGIFWSNQNSRKAFFAIHDDKDPPDTWHSRETPIPGPPGPDSDDHVNLKALQVDGSGRVFAVVKTGLVEANAPLVLVLVRTRGAGWQVHTFARVEDESTRPILLVDEENNKLYVMATSPAGGGQIYYKVTDLNKISFETGKGIPLIASPADTNVDNPTSTKQNLNSQTGLVVLASDRVSLHYLHGYLSLDSGIAPKVNAFQPSSGESSTVVTIQGQGFIGATGVYFGGVPADSFSVLSDNQITATVPGDGQTGKISVTSSTGTGVSSSDFIVLRVPSIAQFSPSYGVPGTSVTITGSGFEGAMSVTFGGVAATFNVVNGTSITATVPPGAVTGVIGVQNPLAAGYSMDPFVVSSGVTSLNVTPVADAMIYQGSPTRTYGELDYLRLRSDASRARRSLLKFDLNGVSGPILEATLRLYVTDGSPDGGVVYLVSNSYLNSSTPWTEQEITWANAPEATGTPVASAGPVSQSTWLELDVSSVVQAAGVYSFLLVSSSSNSTLYSSKEGSASPELVIETGSGSGNNPSGPTISSLSPTSGVVGTSVTVLGSGFLEVSSVSFNGVPASYTVDSSSSLSAVVPSGATSGPISVATSTGTATSGQTFQVLVAPNITGFTPASGPVGTSVAIYGSGFSGTSSVRFKGVSAAFSVINDGEIQSTVPASAMTGVISVATAVSTAYSYTDFTVTVPEPSISSFTPASGPVGTSVVIYGSNLLAISAVHFGSFEATFTIMGASQVNAVVPSGAVTAPIRITTSGYTAESSLPFTVTTPSPVISSISPTSGPVGTLIAVSGFNLDLVTAVTVGGVSSPFNLISPQQISTTVPSGAPSGPVGVVGPSGTAYSSQTFTVTVPGGGSQTLRFSPTADAQIYESYVQSNYGFQDSIRIRDAAGASRRSHLKFAVSGITSAVSRAVLRLYVENGSSDSGTIFSTSNDWTEGGITWANAPQASGAALDNPGAAETGSWIEYNVTGVVSGDGVYSFLLISSSGDSAIFTSREGEASPELVVEVSSGGGSPPPEPAIQSFSPASGGPGTEVVILGSSLFGTTSVSFNGTAALFSVINGGQVNAIVPEGATSGLIRVTTGAGSADSLSGFTVTQLTPSITSISPTSGPIGTLVSIHGNNLHLVSAVYFGGASSGFTLISPEEISTAVPAGATTGPIGVVGPAGTVYSAQSFTVTVPGGGPQTLTFPASADAQVYESYVGSNYGTQDYLRIRDAVGSRRVSHLKFQVSGASSGVVSAVLRLYVEDGSSDAGTIFLTSNDWTEGTITWANAPPVSGSALDSPGAIETGAWVEYNVTGAVAGNGVFSFVVISSSGDSAVFTSREGSTNQPELVIQTN